MASDNDYDGFIYNSSQNYFDIEYQIDSFEIDQYSKWRRLSKKKVKISSYPFSMKSRRCEHPLIKIYGINDKRTLLAEQKLSRYSRYSEKRREKHSKSFECDQQYPMRPDDATPNFLLKGESLENFSHFRRHFYCANHQLIKSSLNSQSNIQILDIRLAPIEKSVQDDFMRILKENSSYPPHLVYHGTQLNNIKSILQYGFLIPSQAHPTNPKAPIITTQNGSAYGSGIYCSETATYSLSYLRNTNTLLVCAALPKRSDAGHVQRSHGNILVLSHVSEIIPLFLIDFRYLNGSGTNHSWFDKQYTVSINVEEDPNKPLIVSKKYLRKVLNSIDDDIQKNKRYRRRKNNRRKVQWDEQCTMRIFEPFNEELLF